MEQPPKKGLKKTMEEAERFLEGGESSLKKTVEDEAAVTENLREAEAQLFTAGEMAEEEAQKEVQDLRKKIKASGGENRSAASGELEGKKSTRPPKETRRSVIVEDQARL